MMMMTVGENAGDDGDEQNRKQGKKREGRGWGGV